MSYPVAAPCILVQNVIDILESLLEQNSQLPIIPFSNATNTTIHDQTQRTDPQYTVTPEGGQEFAAGGWEMNREVVLNPDKK
jgi:hypothetical protein